VTIEYDTPSLGQSRATHAIDGDANGVASATLTLPATVATGLSSIQVAFAGDTYEQPAQTTAPVVVYQPSSFVIWGGNTPGLRFGQRVNFWGSQWEQQVTGGDYNARGAFKGYGTWGRRSSRRAPSRGWCGGRSTSRSARSSPCAPTTAISPYGCRGRRRSSWGWGRTG
jgi:hypothetical protein